jgi:hypothetical protein
LKKRTFSECRSPRRQFLGLGLKSVAALAVTQAYAEEGAKVQEDVNGPAANTDAVGIPWIAGSFRHILHPPGMKQARKTDSRDQWYINDHCFFIDSSERIHWFGITNPYPADINLLYGPGSHRHIGHAVAKHPFGPWEERKDAFTLPEGTIENIGACFVAASEGKYLMVYGYNEGFSFAESDDLDEWRKTESLPVLNLGQGTRDPCILRLDDQEYLLYATAGHENFSSVALASSRDLLHWKQEEPALPTNIAVPWGALESPFVHKQGNDYYLFVNYSHRQYQETLVFQSKDPRRFDWRSPLCTLFAHAAEIFQWRGKTYISHCGIEDRHWSDVVAPYGLWLAELRWTEPAVLEPKRK